MEHKLKVSIISVFFNDKLNIERTIKSVLSQTYNNIEHVVIDGGSSDGSVDIIKKYEPLYNNRLKWVSEPDKGLYDAHNKGIAISTGEYYTILCDEYATIYAIEKLVKAINDKKADGAHCGMYFVRDNKIIRRWSGKSGKIFWGWMPASPGMCLKKSLIEKYGGYRLDYKAGADYELDVRIFKDKSVKLVAVKEPLIYYHAGGASNNGIKGNLLGIKESYKALRDNKMPIPWFTTFCKCAIAFFAYLFASRRIINIDD